MMVNKIVELGFLETFSYFRQRSRLYVPKRYYKLRIALPLHCSVVKTVQNLL